ncbi:MAG: LysM peptidoglycan-binding domain-containing protein [Clostridia bacterium]|nr:LysM peptidoglycan-binding domain-containing protein [Clostridia bacterium]
MLKIELQKYYKVKKGQTLQGIAVAFCLSPHVLARENGLKNEVQEGQILCIPPCRGNAYTANATDTPVLLCGSEENFHKKNGMVKVYPGMRVIL